MKTFDHHAYAPVLWTKRGERVAISSVSTAARSALRPTFVIPPIELDFDTGTPKKTIDQHVAGLPEELASCWGGQEAFIDTYYTGDDLLVSGRHPLDWITEPSLALGLALTPVVSPSSSAATLAAAGLAAARSGDVGIRLEVGEWPTLAGTTAIAAVLSAVGATVADTHLILDMGEVPPTAVDMMGVAAASELRTLPNLADWRSLTLTGAAIPETMPPGPGLHVLPRTEWAVYNRVLAAGVPRLPTFGDNAVASLSPGGDVNPRFMNIAATLRYTVADEWLIGKGGLFKGNGGRSQGAAAVPPAAAHISSHPLFMGAGHCEMDDWITNVVATGTGGGTPEIWRRLGTLHHLEVASAQTLALA